MKLQILTLKSRVAVLEIDCPTAYYTRTPYTLALNGEAIDSANTNVITLFSLVPSMLYTAKVTFENGSELMCEFVTLKEEQYLDVCRFGAVSDGKTDCTAAINAAIASCTKGGTVYVPKGTYLCTPLFLKSHMTLYLDKGACILGNTDRLKYPVLPGVVQEGGQERSLGTWEGNPLDCFASLITAIDCQDLVIAGQGVINANADKSDWWHNSKARRTAWRPRVMFFNGCTNLSVIGLTVMNSPSWTIHPYYCDNVDVLAVTIQNPYNSPNTDGCNIESCKNVRIIGTHVSVGDDCVCFKSGKYYMSHAHYKKCEELLVRNCLLDHGHGAVVIGSEISCGVDGVLVERCIMKNTDRGLRVKTRRGRGNTSIVTNITFSQIEMHNVKTPFAINMFYFCDPDGHSEYVESKLPLPVDKLTPTIGTLICNNIKATGCQYAGAFFYGLPENPIQSVCMQNVEIEFDPNAQEGHPAMLDGIEPMKKKALMALNIKELRLENVVFKGYEGKMLDICQTESLTID